MIKDELKTILARHPYRWSMDIEDLQLIVTGITWHCAEYGDGVLITFADGSYANLVSGCDGGSASINTKEYCISDIRCALGLFVNSHWITYTEMQDMEARYEKERKAAEKAHRDGEYALYQRLKRKYE